MEKIKWKDYSLRKYFMVTVVITVLGIVVASAMTIYGCYYVQKKLLPDSNQIWLHMKTTLADGTIQEATQRVQLNEPTQLSMIEPTDDEGVQEEEKVEYTIERIESSFSTLSPKRKVAYRIAGIAMVALSVIYSVLGVGLCAWYFYRKKLTEPLAILSDAAKNISEQNLDFEITYDCKDELGKLCEAFEDMRKALCENNSMMWRMVEQKHNLQTSVAHDLRNPIAILKGYIEYLQNNIKDGKVTEDKLEHTLSNMEMAVWRMERYTDSIRDINNLHELEVNKETVLLYNTLSDMLEDLEVMVIQSGKEFNTGCNILNIEVKLDKEVIFRILENIVQNAIRYATYIIEVCCEQKNGFLIITVQDDGNGFSEKFWSSKNKFLFTDDTTGEHFGMGLTISRILAEKHGGNIEIIKECEKGAIVKILIQYE